MSFNELCRFFELCRLTYVVFPECHFGKAGNLQTIEPGRSWPNWSAATNGFQSPLRKWYMFVCRECQTEYLYRPDRGFLSGVKTCARCGQEESLGYALQVLLGAHGIAALRSI